VSFEELYAREINIDELITQQEKSTKTLNIIRSLFVPVLLPLCVVISFVLTFVIKNGTLGVSVFFIGLPLIAFAYLILNAIINAIQSNTRIKLSALEQQKHQIFLDLEQSALQTMGLQTWEYTQAKDAYVSVKSSQAVNNYDDIKFFKENEGKLVEASRIMKEKQEYANLLRNFLNDNEYRPLKAYAQLQTQILNNLKNTDGYFIVVRYSSPTGRSNNSTVITVTDGRISQLVYDKTLLMTKSEYNKYLKEQAKEELENKQHDYYEKVNNIIDFANENKDLLVNKADADELDKLISNLFDRTINSIKKIKSVDSEEWDMLDKVIEQTNSDVTAIVDKNNRILEYYNSEDFTKIKTTCDTLMNSQREFNEYIDEKVKSISDLFGKNVMRNETAIEDEYNYIHPYKKSITPFTAEVSATVFASAENNPLEYVVKQFYPNKSVYPEQIQKLQLLIEELETLKEAKEIIENYKQDVQQYLSDVPDFIMENDEDGFYSRLGFATINENTLTVEYKFSYTSNGGKAQRSFTIPMTEETIVKLIEMLQSKLTMSAFTKEQRSLMTSKLRMYIKERDNFTCKMCGNSTHAEPNLLLEVDHIIPVAKGGYTEESNLQTLCWKCNRSKSAKLL